jgi:hypothetical protein
MFPNLQNKAINENEIVPKLLRTFRSVKVHIIGTPVSLVVNKLTSLQIYKHDAFLAAIQPIKIRYVLI